MPKLSIFLPCFLMMAPSNNLAAQSTDQDLSGIWNFTVFEGQWKVELKRNKSKESGDDPLSKDYPVYCGTAKAEPKNDSTITPEICAFQDVKEKKLKLYISIIVCDAPFKTKDTMEGQCLFAFNTAKGVFRATRISDSPAPNKSLDASGVSVFRN